jgi:hypothetical protein
MSVDRRGSMRARASGLVWVLLLTSAPAVADELMDIVEFLKQPR